MELPDFNESALTSLTQKIQKNLQHPPLKKQENHQSRARKAEAAGDQGAPKRVKKDADSTSESRKRSRDGQTKAPRPNGNQGNEVEKRSFGKPGKGTNVPKDRGVISPKKKKTLTAKGLKQDGPTHDTIKDKASTSAHVPSTQSGLRNEVFALGGTEEDVRLIEDAASESEYEGSTGQFEPSKIRKDLEQMIRTLGIQQASSRQDDASSNDEQATTQDSDKEIDANSIPLKPRVIAASQTGRDVKKGTMQLVFEPRAEWHSAQLPMIGTLKEPSIPQKEFVEQLHTYAKELLEKENHAYAESNGSSTSAHQFYSTIMSSGTLSDKISALTLSVQESPVHNMRALETLVGLARKRSRGQAVEVLGALKDLLGLGSLLPSDRRLCAFSNQPSLVYIPAKEAKTWGPGKPLPSSLQEIHLVSWAYEDWLKSTYFDILKIIEVWCNDEIVFARGKAVDYVFELLRDKPEQEANLLRLLINKLGDSDKKIASKTSYNILQLQNSHPLMKPMIISSIESDILFRPGQNMHAKYYAIITINQTILTSKEESVARKVLDIYFSLFLTLLGKPQGAQSVIPVVKPVTINKNGDLQGGGGAPGKKAQKKQALHAKSAQVDGELREKMLSAVLTGVNRALPFVDTNDNFFEKHLDTLFRVTHSSNFNTSIQALMLIQQLCGSYQAASDRFYRTLYESLLDPRILTASKQALYLNLLFRALRSDLNLKRVKAFAKRLLQIIAMHQPPFACAVIYLLRELEGVFANLHTFIDQPEEDESDEEEVFHDVRESHDMEISADRAAEAASKKTVKSYDGKKREPEFSNAERSCLWEIDPFLAHYHPSVSLFASKLVSHEQMPAKPDLSTNTLIHFLDRFVYRNPKKSAGGPRGASIMQPLAGHDNSGLLVSARGMYDSEMPVNTQAFRTKEGEKINADEVFFHKYFTAVGQRKDISKKKEEKKRPTQDDPEDGDEEDEGEIWKALVDSRPELEGDDESEADLDLDDFDSELSVGTVSDEESGEPDTFTAEGMDDESEGLAFDDDEDALLGSDDEVPGHLDTKFAQELQFAVDKATGKGGKEKRSEKRRRLKNLPTFASADDYAAMLEEDGE